MSEQCYCNDCLRRQWERDGGTDNEAQAAYLLACSELVERMAREYGCFSVAGQDALAVMEKHGRKL